MPKPSPLLLALALAVPLILPACGGKEEGGSTQGNATETPSAGGYAGGAGGSAAGLSADLQRRVDEAMAKGRALLVGAQDADTGAFGDPEQGLPPNVGYTALATGALIAATPSSRVAGDAAIKKGLDWLAHQQKEDGSIFDNPRFVNYMTSAAIGPFAYAKLPEYARVMAKARDFLVASQIATDPKDPSYGGFPYVDEDPGPADLSNLQFAATALADAGLPADSVVWKRIETYLKRAQNRSESNDARVEIEIDGKKVTAVSGNDGGAGYGPGMSKPGFIERPDGTVEPRSYGSMTYALLKCLLLAGVDAKDPRVAAALGWISRNFTVGRNPGFESTADPAKEGQQGFYYYVFTMARALAEYERLTKKPLEVKDASGKSHDWRSELAEELLKRRRADGWWVNTVADRWDEGSVVLSTSYAMQTLAEISGRFR
jgi:hypothetical protein